MASPATAAGNSVTGGASSQNGTTTPTTNTPASKQAYIKPSYVSALGGQRKTENASGPAPRQAPVKTAWATGTLNPLTQRVVSPNQQNGGSGQARSTTVVNNSPYLKEGYKVTVTLDSAAEYEGIYLAGTTSEHTLKMVQQKKAANGELNGTNKLNKYVGNDSQHTMSFQKQNIVNIHVTGTSLPKHDNRSQNGTSSSFRTDTAISGHRAQGERTLQRWVPDAPEEVDTSLEAGRAGMSSGGGWDQFAANEKLFGLQTDYDENIYTTSIDRSHPQYQQRLAEADRVARDIENSVATNSHIAEERVADNLTTDNSGLDEEDKYSGVQRQDFPPLASTNRSNKYTPPARRPPTGQATVSGAPVDPAIISSQLARPDKQPAQEKSKPVPAVQAPAKTEAAPPATVTPAVASATPAAAPTATPAAPAPASTTSTTTAPAPEVKSVPSLTSVSTSRTVSPKARAQGTPNATDTVERDVASAFKGFAAQQRMNVEKSRANKARADKEVKLNDLKKFADSFKLNTPVPADLVSIIAKDPAKQKEIQEKAKRNAEEVKANPPQATKPAGIPTDPKAQRPGVTGHGTSPSGASSRQNANRSGFTPQQGPYPQPSRSAQGQNISSHHGRPAQNMNNRLRVVDQGKTPLQAGAPGNHEARIPPTGPASTIDSRRSSNAPSLLGAPRLNPNSSEFRPNAAAPTFSPAAGPSAASSPRSGSAVGQAPPAAAAATTTSFLRRKPIPDSERPSLPQSFDVIAHLKTFTPPNDGAKKTWAANGDMKPAYDTPATWKAPNDTDKPESAIHKTYKQMFDILPFSGQPLSPAPPSHVNPQVPHQHQLPFHLQQGAMSQRPSPRQPQMHMHANHQSQPHFGPNDHQMVPSHSAQSFASPRLQQVPLVYPSPMNQHAQLAYNQQAMQYPMGAGAPQMAQYRSYSGNQHFNPQQPTHMSTPVMIPGPPGNGFMPGPQGMVPSGPPMQMYPAGQGHFIPQNGHPPPMMANGYPSPSRGAPMMMNQGSQQGQPIYGMSPGMQYGQPVYAQQQPGQMPGMRGFQGPQGQQYGSSPQHVHHYGGQHRGPGGNHKNYQPQHPPHPSNQQPNQGPNGPPARADGEEAK